MKLSSERCMGSGCLDDFYQATGGKLGRSVASKFSPEAECERKFP